MGKAIALDSDSEEVSSYHDSGDEDRKEEVEIIEEVVEPVIEEPKGPQCDCGLTIEMEKRGEQ